MLPHLVNLAFDLLPEGLFHFAVGLFRYFANRHLWLSFRERLVHFSRPQIRVRYHFFGNDDLFGTNSRFISYIFPWPFFARCAPTFSFFSVVKDGIVAVLPISDSDCEETSLGALV